MACCCPTLPIGNNPKTQFNTMRMDPDGTVVWQVDWSAIRGLDGMTPFYGALRAFRDDDRSLSYMMHVLDDAYLTAVGVKDGTVHVASLNISDGTEYTTLTDSTETIDVDSSSRPSTHSVVVSGTPDKILFYNLELVAATYTLYKYEAEADGTVTKSTVGSFTLNDSSASPFLTSKMNSDGDAVVVGVETTFQTASDDYVHVLDSSGNLEQYLDDLMFDVNLSDDGYVYGRTTAGSSFDPGGWWRSAIPLGGGWTKISDFDANDRSRQLSGPGFVSDATFSNRDAVGEVGLFDYSAGTSSWTTEIVDSFQSYSLPPFDSRLNARLLAGHRTADDAYWFVASRVTETDNSYTFGMTRYDRSGNTIGSPVRPDTESLDSLSIDPVVYTESSDYVVASWTPLTQNNTAGVIAVYEIQADRLRLSYKYCNAPTLLHTEDSSGDLYFAWPVVPPIEISSFGLCFTEIDEFLDLTSAVSNEWDQPNPSGLDTTNRHTGVTTPSATTQIGVIPPDRNTAQEWNLEILTAGHVGQITAYVYAYIATADDDSEFAAELFVDGAWEVGGTMSWQAGESGWRFAELATGLTAADFSSHKLRLTPNDGVGEEYFEAIYVYVTSAG